MSITKMIFTIISLALVISSGQSVEVEYRKEEFLRITNYLRSSVVPVPSNMHKLTWDDGLAKEAGISAAKCNGKHTEGSLTYYQNLVSGGSNNLTTNLMYFFMERKFYDYYKPDAKTSEETGHYKILSKGSMTKMGCAITKTKCNGQYFVYCNYRAEELGWGKYNYLHQKPCSQCSVSYSFCENGLCVASSNSCKKICRNCGYFYDKNCRCYCGADFLSASDCSVPDPGATMGDCKNCVSHTPVYRKLCENGGKMVAPKCGSCECPDGYKGEWCQYNVAEHKNGVMLIFHWSEFYNGGQKAYYPMNSEQGHTILKLIKPIIVKKLKAAGKAVSDVKIGAGYPRLDEEGRLHVLIVVNGGKLGGSTLLSSMQSGKDEMKAIVGVSTGTTLDEMKIGNI